MASHQEVAHRWAQDTNAKLTGFNMFCRDGMLFSYGEHFVLGRFADTPARRGKPSRRVILLNTDSRSISTSKHQSYTRRAIPQGAEVYEVPGLDRYSDFGNATTAARVLAYHEDEAAKLYAKAGRARVNGPWLVRQAEGHLAAAEAFAAAFGHRWKRPALTEVESVAKARADKQRREADKRAREQARLAAIRQAEQRAHDAEAFGLWQRGATNVRCPASYYSDEDGGAYVRRFTDSEGADLLQTSQGATVPWDHAVKAFRFIRLCVEKGEGWERNGRTVRVGHYTLDRIEPNGDMRAGCHRFTWSRMRELAEREGVLDLAPSAEAVTVTH